MKKLDKTKAYYYSELSDIELIEFCKQLLPDLPKSVDSDSEDLIINLFRSATPKVSYFENGFWRSAEKDILKYLDIVNAKTLFE